MGCVKLSEFPTDASYPAENFAAFERPIAQQRAEIPRTPASA